MPGAFNLPQGLSKPETQPSRDCTENGFAIGIIDSGIPTLGDGLLNIARTLADLDLPARAL